MSQLIVQLPYIISNTVVGLPARKIVAIYEILRESPPRLDEVNRLRAQALEGVIDRASWILLDTAWNEALRSIGRSDRETQMRELLAFRRALDSCRETEDVS